MNEAVAVLHICYDCPVHHYDNCPDCFGFGVRKSGYPITAGRAVWIEPSEVVRCPTCGSDEHGVPR